MQWTHDARTWTWSANRLNNSRATVGHKQGYRRATGGQQAGNRRASVRDSHGQEVNGGVIPCGAKPLRGFHAASLYHDRRAGGVCCRESRQCLPDAGVCSPEPNRASCPAGVAAGCRCHCVFVRCGGGLSRFLGPMLLRVRSRISGINRLAGHAESAFPMKIRWTSGQESESE